MSRTNQWRGWVSLHGELGWLLVLVDVVVVVAPRVDFDRIPRRLSGALDPTASVRQTSQPGWQGCATDP